MQNYIVNRGDVFYADLGIGEGSIQSGIRPVVVIQNNMGNKYSPTLQIAPLTSQNKKSLPTHVNLFKSDIVGLSKDSTLLIEQAKVIDKKQLKQKIATLNSVYMVKVNLAILVSYGMADLITNNTMQLISQCA